MFVFNEGVPRSGKSYDAVKFHILPALKKGRHVWARLNGLEQDEKRQAIADYLKLPREHIEKYLHHIETKDVVRTFQAYPDSATGKWLIADEFKNSLVVIDEVHQFYVAQRKPLEQAIEEFFALFGQNGGDGVIMTQFFNRLHSAVKARIERKNSFQKLTAVGLEGKYAVTYYHSTAAGKFEKVSTATKSYDEEIFPLYLGYAEGADNTEVYKEGGTNLWLSMAPKALLYATLAGVGLYFFAGYFFKHRGEPKSATPAAAVASSVNGLSSAVAITPEQKAAVTGAVAPKPDPFKDLTPEQRYVFEELKGKGRVRLQALAQVGRTTRAWVEWVDNQGNQVEALEMAQLVALGVDVQVQGYGLRLSAGEHVMVATPWPREVRARESDHKLYDISPRTGPAGVASVASEAGSARSTPHASIDGAAALERQPQAQL